MDIVIEDPRLNPILEKVRAGARLSAEDGAVLEGSADLLAVGYMANLVRERLHGAAAYFSMEAGEAAGYGGADGRVARLIELRDRQDAGAGIAAFAAVEAGASGFLEMRSVAVARLMLDNVLHIRVPVAAMTPAVAQIALRFGADDWDASGSVARAEIVRLIRAAGREPAERDEMYRAVVGREAAFPVLA